MRVLCQIDGVNQVLLHHGKTVAPVLRKLHSDFPENTGDIFRTINFAAVGKQVTVVERETLAVQSESLLPHLPQNLRRRIVAHNADRHSPVRTQEQRQRVHFQHFLSAGIFFLSGNCVQHLPASVLPDQKSHMGIHRRLVRSHHGLAFQTAAQAEYQVALLQQGCVQIRRQSRKRWLAVPRAGRKDDGQKKKKQTGKPPAISTSDRFSTHRPA